MPLFYDHPMIQTCLNHIKPHQTTITPLNSIETSCFSHQTNLRKKQVAGNSIAASTLPVVVPLAMRLGMGHVTQSLAKMWVLYIYIYI